MKKYLIYLAAATAMLASCDDDFSRPPLVLPETVKVEPTVTMEQFKTDFWKSVDSPTTIGMLNEQGDSVIFSGRVCSSDESGNIFKNIVIQSRNEGGEQIAMTFAVNAYDLFETLPFGQEVAVYATGLSIGGYRGLLQFGAISGDQMTFMDSELFTTHVVRTGKGLPEPALVDTTVTTIAEVIAAKGSEETLRLWQSRLVRVQGVSFVDAGQPFAGTQNVSRYVVDAEGNRLVVRNSSYASFSADILPSGTGDIVGILSYYGSDWQMLLLDADGCIGFTGGDNPTPGTEPGTTVEPTGDGTAEKPYNVAKALQVIAAGPAETEVYVKGKITKIEELDTSSFGNATYEIADEGVSATLKIYRGYWFNGDKFTSADQLAVGAEVVVLGKLVNFMGNTPEMAQGNKIISYNGQTGGDTPNPPAGEGQTIFSALSESLTEMPADWTIQNVTLPEGGSYVWSWKVYENKGYLNANAYIDKKAKASEAYAISPVIDLIGATGCSLSFDHAAKFQTTLRTLCGVVARVEGTAEWTTLAIPAWPEAGAWTFANSGNVDLSAFDGKKIQIAFKYASTAEGADIWEIKNLTVTGKK